MCKVSKRLAEGMIPKGYSFALDIASASIDLEELQHEDANVFGCSEDHSAYALKANPVPQCEDLTFRTAAGHIHCGHVALDSFDNKISMVRIMDCMHGLISCVLDQNEGTAERRKLYGKAGTYRPTEYGIEYRTLSNFWMQSEELMELMWLLTRDALRLVVEDRYLEYMKIFEDQEVDVESDINANEHSHMCLHASVFGVPWR